MNSETITKEHIAQVSGQISQHVFLTGRPPISEYIGFVQGMAVNGQFLPQGPLVADWRKANQRIHQLEVLEKEIADSPTIKPIPSSLKHLEKEVVSSAIFQSNFGNFPSKIAMVNLEQIIVYQKFINVAFVDSIIERLGNEPTEEDIFKMSLGLNRLDPPVKSMRNGNGFTFISPSNDFRFLNVVPVEKEQIPTEMLNGYASDVFGFVFGYGSNCFNVFNINNRLILNNGSHRAYALYKMGIKEVPCIIQDIATKDELALVGNPELVNNFDRYFADPRPPMLKDYFDPQLTKSVPVQSKNRMVRLQFGIEVVDVPAT